MKKFIFTTLAFGAFSMGIAQTQRMVLVEEYTQASCGPCAAQNPALNALLANNTNKVVSLKYQVSWPGVDPMNAQNPTEVATRVSYYNVTSVPHVKMDGSTIGAPSSLTQSVIDNRYAVPTPFDLNVTHVMSNDYDSAYVTVTITAAQNYTAGATMRFRLAMVEKEINFTTPPGSNGELDFYMVMRKMYPNASGTTLASSWTNLQTQTLNFAVAVPSYIYDINEVGFVGFIQEDASTIPKVVHNVDFSQPIPLQFDAGVNAVNNIPSLNCTGNMNVSVVITNESANNLTSCDINYQVDANTPQVLPWTGNLAPQAFSTVALPTISAGDGSHTLTVWTSNPNGNIDQYPANDARTYNFVVNLVPSAAPVSEGFQNTTWPPTDWAVYNTDNYGFARWTSAGGFGNSTASTKMDFYNAPANSVDELISPMVDLSPNTTAASLTFNVAYNQYNTLSIDRLEVKVSTDCGANWSTLFNKAGAALRTAANPQTNAFNPAPSQWRNEIVDLSPFAGNNDVIIKFVATSNSGNNLFIDDINIVNTTGINENSNMVSMNLFPNPTSDAATVEFTLLKEGVVSIEVLNMLGERVYLNDMGSVKSGNVLLGSSLPAGIYNVSVVVDNQRTTRLLNITK